MNNKIETKTPLFSAEFFTFLESEKFLIAQKNKLHALSGVPSYGYMGVLFKKKIAHILRTYFLDEGNFLEHEPSTLISKTFLEESGHIGSDLPMFELKSQDKTSIFLNAETTQSVMSILDSYPLIKQAKKIFTQNKVFRNEASPQNFFLRAREFELLEAQLFLNPEVQKFPDMNDDEEEILFRVLKKNKITLFEEEEFLKLYGPKFTQLCKFILKGLYSLGFHKPNILIEDVPDSDKAFYSQKTLDLVYRVDSEEDKYLEIGGIANRTGADLKNHKNRTKTYEHYEISLGLDRIVLSLLFQSYEQDPKRGEFLLLPFERKIYDFVLAPLIANNQDVYDFRKKLYEKYNSKFKILFLTKGTIGRRYNERDRLGIPYVLTIDFETLDSDTVTIRKLTNREQRRISLSKITTVTTNTPYYD
jgi:glycyl-tRNA synthetase